VPELAGATRGLRNVDLPENLSYGVHPYSRTKSLNFYAA
jgi:hypothetical protein